MMLLLGTMALLLGPLIYSVGRRNPVTERLLNAVILFTIGYIIAFHIAPDAFQHGGALAIGVLLVGLLFPVALERLFRKATDSAHKVVVAIAAFGLLVHAIIDGIALLPESGAGLAYAIILHRLPVGMAIWWAIQQQFGNIATFIAFATVVAATAAGYWLGADILQMADARSLALLQAFVSGSLIHIVLFGIKHEHPAAHSGPG